MRKKSKIAYIIVALLLTSMFSCKQKKICAAYNSYFVHDDSNIELFFMPFGNDSLPPEKKEGRFNARGLISRSGARDDARLNKYDKQELKKAAQNPADSLSANLDDSTGAIISVKELFPEKINTDQEAYDHYVGELLEQYKKEKEQPAANQGPPDSTAYYKNRPDNLTKEEKKEWKREKKAYKKRKKERERREREEARKKEEEEANQEEEEEFDFDL